MGEPSVLSSVDSFITSRSNNYESNDTQCRDDEDSATSSDDSEGCSSSSSYSHSDYSDDDSESSSSSSSSLSSSMDNEHSIERNGRAHDDNSCVKGSNHSDPISHRSISDNNFFSNDGKNNNASTFRRRRRRVDRTTDDSSTSPSKGAAFYSRTNSTSKRRSHKQSSPGRGTVSVMHSLSSKVLLSSFLFWAIVQIHIILLSNNNNNAIISPIYDEIRSQLFHIEYLLKTRGLSGREKKAWVVARRRNRDNDGRSYNGELLYGGYNHRYDNYNTPDRMERLRQEAKRALGSAAAMDDDEIITNDDYTPYQQSGKPNVKRHKRKNKRSSQENNDGSTRTERLREGCQPLEWHSYHYPNCNEIHEIDLRYVVRKRRYGVDRERLHQDESANNHNDGLPWGFVGNGLWRDVFSCDPHSEISSSSSDAQPSPPAVLKIMKSEHPYDQRNFQRHRRDALVMELLASSHHVVPIYGYCANTVLTRSISHSLDDVIYAREKERIKTWSPDGGYKTKAKIESWMGKDADGELLATRETELGRVRLALGVFRGLMDLHEGVGYKNAKGNEVEWLPIIHADLQAKQYLVDSTTGMIYLNDFNRCRFVTKKDTNATDNHLESCPVYIPTSPGSSRSPEEYDSAPLSEKLDVYSAGNILYGIITGERPWDNERGKHIKASIQRGDRPEVDEAIRNDVGSVDWELTKLLDRVYEGDPEKRASAKEVVRELENLLEKLLQKERKTS
eukprot:scaffold18741_cov60-Cyclotella_meneghiniana.AAC.1